MTRSFLILALMALGTAAPAQEFAAKVDVKAVNACFAGTASFETSPPCVGAQAEICMRAPGGSTTQGIVACASAETAAWDAILNTQYQARMSAAAPNVKAALRTAQRAWIVYRDAECALHYEKYAEGTIRSTYYAACMQAEISERAFELRDFERL